MAARNRTSGNTSTQGTWDLAENSATRLPRGRPATLVRVERGTVLVTQEGTLEDHVLEAGDIIILGGRGLAVAWAFTEAVISVRESALTIAKPRRSSLQSGRSSAPVAAGVM
jgi:hypothetical protein